LINKEPKHADELHFMVCLVAG